MPKSPGCCLLLLYAYTVGLYSVSVSTNISKSGCLGDSIKIFENISFGSDDTVVSIYKISDTDVLMATWYKKNTVPSVAHVQSDRIFLDKNGNIWILDLQTSNEATYKIKVNMGDISENHEVALNVLVAPTKNCKPEILRTDNILSAHLKIEECGTPAAHVEWLEHPGIPVTSEIIKLQPGQNNGVYHACIKSDALRCVKISSVSEYCTIFNESYISPASTVSSNIPTLMYVVAYLWLICLPLTVVGSALCIVVFLKKLLKRRRHHYNDKRELDTFLDHCSDDGPTPGKEKTDDESLCIICYKRDVTVLFLPCRHFVTCQDCANGATKCPKCKAAIYSTASGYSKQKDT